MVLTPEQTEKQKEGPAHYTKNAGRTFVCDVTGREEYLGWSDLPNNPPPATQLEHCPFCGKELGTDKLADTDKLSPYWKKE